MNERLSLSTKGAETNPQEEPGELTQIRTDRSLPLPLRVRRFVCDVRDPYHFTVYGTDVRIRFAGNNSIGDRLACALSADAVFTLPGAESGTIA